MTRKHKKTSALTVIALFAVVLVVVFLLKPSLFPFSLNGDPTIVTPGWELYDQIVGVESGNQLYTQSSQFTNPNFISGPLWKFDVDDPQTGIPTVEVTIGDIHHVDFSGKDIPDNQPAETLPTITRGNQTYELDDHIYLFTVTIRSIADIDVTGINHGGFETVPEIWHETDWPHNWYSTLGSQGNDNKGGKQFDGGIYVAFVIEPWRGSSSDTSVSTPTNYTLTKGWAGVMNAYVLSQKEGQVANQYGASDPNNNNGMPTPDPDSSLQVRGSIADGNQVPMFLDSGTFSSSAPTTSFDSSLSPDTRIPSSVALYLPIQIFPGAKTHLNSFLTVDNLYPVDGYIMYNVRVDVLQEHEFTLQTAVNPPNPGIPGDYYTWAQSWWVDFLHGIDPFAFLGPLEPLAWWLVTFGVVALILIVVVSVFAPWVLPRLINTAKGTYKAVKGS